MACTPLIRFRPISPPLRLQFSALEGVDRGDGWKKVREKMSPAAEEFSTFMSDIARSVVIRSPNSGAYPHNKYRLWRVANSIFAL
jgi:hypothetical protein